MLQRTSNAVVNITGNSLLSSIVTLTGLDNITIIGKENLTVNCNGTGAIEFVSCNK